MNLRLMCGLLDLYHKVKRVPGERVMKLGWKTITGSILVGLGFAAKALSFIEPSLDGVGDGLIALGAIVGGVGVRAAIDKGPSRGPS